jgi:hypothetical protein
MVEPAGMRSQGEKLASLLINEMGVEEATRWAKAGRQQTQRLYMAQSMTGLYDPHEPADDCDETIQRVLDEFAEQYDVPRVKVISAPWDQARACYFEGEIWMPPHYRSPFVGIHEFAHHVISVTAGSCVEGLRVGHDRIYCDMQLAILADVIPVAADVLEMMMVFCGVDFTPRNLILEGA